MNRLLQHLFQFLQQIWRRLRSIVRRRKHEREMEEEMRFHLEMQIEQNLAAGMAAEEARYAARRQFGNQTWLKEASRDMWILRFIETLFQDLRYGARMLMKNPGFSLIAIFTLALGIGANTAIFSLVNAVLLRSLPLPHAERLVFVSYGRLSDPKFEGAFSPQNFTDTQRRNQSFDSYFALKYVVFTLTGDQAPEALNGIQASSDFGRVVGMAPAESLINSIRRAVLSIDPEQPIRRAQLLETAISKTLAPQRLVTVLLSLFAALALTLAMIGIYGVMSYSVAQRTQEIGIRMALGAEKSAILNMIIGQGIKLALIGVAIGIAAALGLTQFLSGLLYGVRPGDPLTLVAVSALVTAVALLASYIPARQAAKVDPMITLKHE